MLYQNLQKFVKVNLRRAVVPTHTQFNLCELFSRQPLFPTGLLSFIYFCGSVRARFPCACYTHQRFSLPLYVTIAKQFQ